ncbi:MAG: xanthine dehydrogenase family protein subunit M [Firmicutes bacterium]|nr:xanthine dehydrogenase family protein subunit M [Bacillota bacterium]
MKNFQYFKPKSLKEASEILSKHKGKAHILNGGTDLIIRMRDRIIEPEVVVDIKEIDELNSIHLNKHGELIIGACVNLNDIAHNKIVDENYDFLSKAAHMVGSSQVRNRATMVGNICNASPLADTATPLLALDAKVLVYGAEGKKEISIHDFFIWVRKTCLKIGEIVIGIKIPSYSNDILGDFQKISRRKMVDLSTVCGTVLKNGDDIRIALGAVSPTPIRLRKTEGFIKGKELTEEVIKKALEVAVSEISPIDDIRASKEYRINMTKVIIKRGLKKIRQKNLALAEG